MEDIIIIKDEKDEVKTLKVEIIEFNTAFVTFRTTHGSLITYPFDRVLKIKQKGGIYE